MELLNEVSRSLANIPRMVWIIGIGIVIAAIAIFIFSISVNTVAYYAFLAFMFGSHFFMHGSHGGHGSSKPSNHNQRSVLDSPRQGKDEHSVNSGGCH